MLTTEMNDWFGKWIWHAPMEGKGSGNELVYFRHALDIHIDEVHAVHTRVSADSRYRLFVNGQSVGIGPCKGDVHTQYYETYDLLPYLRNGFNLIAVKVLHFGAGGPATVSGPSSVYRSPWGGFLLDGAIIGKDKSSIRRFGTDADWRCMPDASYRLEYESWLSGTWMGGMERVDGALLPHGWERPDYDDAAWSRSVVVKETTNPYGITTPWPLEPRSIPALYERPRSFMQIVRSSDSLASPLSQAAAILDESDDKLDLMPRQSYWLELDAGELTTGYIHIGMTGGKGSVIALICSECYEEFHAGERVKGIRDDHSGGRQLVGDSDVYLTAGRGAGGGLEVYEPFWFRTFRYVRIEIATGDEPLSLYRIGYRENGYPLEVKAEFRCSEESFTPLWDISLRTLKRCMHETYEDCPYYEQLQYTMDAGLQMQFTYYTSNDDRLARKTIQDYHSSRLPDGMLQSRYPTVESQVIPGFALYWIFMLHDHYCFYGDDELVRDYAATADGVLRWFEKRIDDSGLVGQLPNAYWSYVDWAAGWNNGVPPAGEYGPLTVYNLIYAAALEKAAQLNAAIGRNDTALQYRQLADSINAKVKELCWSQHEQLFQDGPGVEQYGQQAQLWSVLSGLSTGQDAYCLMARTLEREDIAQVSYSMAYYLFRALSLAGAYRLSFPLWEKWHVMVRNGMTTWAEEPNGNRSDCHAWGATPLYEFPAQILGVAPESPGFETIRIEPHPGPLTHAAGSVPTPAGKVDVAWSRNGEVFTLRVDGPEDVTMIIVMPDGSQAMARTGVFEGACRYV